jgi:uncharacterized protein
MGKFVINKTTNGEFFFNLRAGNGVTILTSELYSSRSSCVHGIKSVRKYCTDDNKYERMKSVNQKYFFNFKASHRQVIGRSENYETEAGMEHGIASVKKNGQSDKLVEGHFYSLSLTNTYL